MLVKLTKEGKLSKYGIDADAYTYIFGEVINTKNGYPKFEVENTSIIG